MSWLEVRLTLPGVQAHGYHGGSNTPYPNTEAVAPPKGCGECQQQPINYRPHQRLSKSERLSNMLSQALLSGVSRLPRKICVIRIDTDQRNRTNPKSTERVA
jgi:hypothetical protein